MKGEKRTVIELVDGYTCDVVDGNYILVKHGRSKKGKPTAKNIGYYSDLSKAITRLIEELSLDGIQGRTVSLTEAVESIRESQKRMSKLLMEILETGVKVK